VVTLYHLAQALGVRHVEAIIPDKKPRTKRTSTGAKESNDFINLARPPIVTNPLVGPVAEEMNARKKAGYSVAGYHQGKWGALVCERADEEAKNPARWSGRGLLRSGSLAVLLTATRPDEVEGVAVCDEIGVDRDGEARIVQLDREKVAAFDQAAPISARPT
jgi:hypothetical protein